VFQGNGQQNDLIKLARTAGIYLAVFLVGGLFAFAYSYSPLHNAKNWKIDYLNGRLEAQTSRLAEVTGELGKLQADSASRPDAETFGMLQNELASTDKTIGDLERKLEKSERRVKELEQSRKNWRAKARAAENKSEALAAELKITPAAEAPSAPGADPLPAAPAASAGDTAAPAVSAPLQ
jgi:septal ring factor EnvC (AmiA/AmiB activator)